MIVQEVAKAFRSAPPYSKLYIGSDSVRFKKKGQQPMAKITVVAVLHLAGRHGCKVFGFNRVERVYDKNLGKPQHRMMLEAYEVSKLFLELKQELPDADIEVHLDINPNEEHGSSCAAKQAAGYITGVCQVIPKLKPVAWAASTCADLFNSKINQKF